MEAAIYLGQGRLSDKVMFEQRDTGGREALGSLEHEWSRQMQEPEQHVLTGQVPGKAIANGLEE